MTLHWYYKEKEIWLPLGLEGLGSAYFRKQKEENKRRQINAKANTCVLLPPSFFSHPNQIKKRSIYLQHRPQRDLTPKPRERELWSFTDVKQAMGIYFINRNMRSNYARCSHVRITRLWKFTFTEVKSQLNRLKIVYQRSIYARFTRLKI